MKNKKGSHVEFVLSFMIFVSAIIFIYLIVGSLIPKEVTEKNVLNSLTENILNELNSETYVLRTFSEGASCVRLNKPDFPEEGFTLSTEGSSFADSNFIYAEGTGFITIYYSEGIGAGEDFSTGECTSASLDSVRVEKRIFERSVVNLMNNFSENYDSLKNSLGVSSGFNINLYFEYDNGSSIGTERDVSAEVYSKDVNFHYLSNGAVEKGGLLRVKVWK